MRHTRERLDGMHFVLPSKTNAALKFSRRASPLSGYYFFEVPRSFASRRVACSFPPLPLHVQFSCLFNSQSRSFQSFYDPNVSSSLFSLLSSLFSFSRLSSADTIIADIISRASIIPLGKPPYACDNLHRSADDITGYLSLLDYEVSQPCRSVISGLSPPRERMVLDHEQLATYQQAKRRAPYPTPTPPRGIRA